MGDPDSARSRATSNTAASAGGTKAAARARATTASPAIPRSRDADGTKAYVGYGVDSLTAGPVAICRVKFASETRDAVASLYPAAEEARITCAIVDAAAKVRVLQKLLELFRRQPGVFGNVRHREGVDGIVARDGKPDAPVGHNGVFAFPRDAKPKFAKQTPVPHAHG
jgi:hypothetical protein